MSTTAVSSAEDVRRRQLAEEAEAKAREAAASEAALQQVLTALGKSLDQSTRDGDRAPPPAPEEKSMPTSTDGPPALPAQAPAAPDGAQQKDAAAAATGGEARPTGDAGKAAAAAQAKERALVAVHPKALAGAAATEELLNRVLKAARTGGNRLPEPIDLNQIKHHLARHYGLNGGDVEASARVAQDRMGISNIDVRQDLEALMPHLEWLTRPAMKDGLDVHIRTGAPAGAHREFRELVDKVNARLAMDWPDAASWNEPKGSGVPASSAGGLLQAMRQEMKQHGLSNAQENTLLRKILAAGHAPVPGGRDLSATLPNLRLGARVLAQQAPKALAMAPPPPLPNVAAVFNGTQTPSKPQSFNATVAASQMLMQGIQQQVAGALGQQLAKLDPNAEISGGRLLQIKNKAIQAALNQTQGGLDRQSVANELVWMRASPQYKDFLKGLGQAEASKFDGSALTALSFFDEKSIPLAEVMDVVTNSSDPANKTRADVTLQALQTANATDPAKPVALNGEERKSLAAAAAQYFISAVRYALGGVGNGGKWAANVGPAIGDKVDKMNKAMGDLLQRRALDALNNLPRPHNAPGDSAQYGRAITEAMASISKDTAAWNAAAKAAGLSGSDQSAKLAAISTAKKVSDGLTNYGVTAIGAMFSLVTRITQLNIGGTSNIETRAQTISSAVGDVLVVLENLMKEGLQKNVSAAWGSLSKITHLDKWMQMLEPWTRRFKAPFTFAENGPVAKWLTGATAVSRNGAGFGFTVYGANGLVSAYRAFRENDPAMGVPLLVNGAIHSLHGLTQLAAALPARGPASQVTRWAQSYPLSSATVLRLIASGSSVAIAGQLAHRAHQAHQRDELR